jgi:hypothetical protein
MYYEATYSSPSILEMKGPTMKIEQAPTVATESYSFVKWTSGLAALGGSV